MAAPVAAARVFNGVQDTPIDSDNAPYYRAKLASINAAFFAPTIISSRGFSGQASLATADVASFAPSGLFVGQFVQRAAVGAVDISSFVPALSMVQWTPPVPSYAFDRSTGAYPKLLTAVRASYLSNPTAIPVTVGMLPIYPTYDASSRGNYDPNALPDIAYLNAVLADAYANGNRYANYTIPNFQPGDRYGLWNDPTPYTALSSLAFADFGQITDATFAAVASGANAYSIAAVGTVVSGTGQLTIPPPSGDMTGRKLICVIASFGASDAITEDPLDYNPISTGLSSIAVYEKNGIAAETARTATMSGASVKVGVIFALTSTGGWNAANLVAGVQAGVNTAIAPIRYQALPTSVIQPVGDTMNLCWLQIGMRLLTTGEALVEAGIGLTAGYTSVARRVVTGANGVAFAIQMANSDLGATGMPQNDVTLSGTGILTGGSRRVSIALRGSPPAGKVPANVPMVFIDANGPGLDGSGRIFYNLTLNP